MVYTLQVPMAQWPEEPAQITILDEDVPCAAVKDRGRAPQLLSCSGDSLFVIRIVYCPSWKKEGLITDCRMDIP